MSTIWKYRLHLGSHGNRITLRPRSASWPWIRVANQNGQITLWAEIDPDRDEDEWILWVVPTGGLIPAGANYVGSCDVGAFVWHVYVEGSRAHWQRTHPTEQTPLSAEMFGVETDSPEIVESVGIETTDQGLSE